MKLEKHFLDECQWLYANLESFTLRTEYFIELSAMMHKLFKGEISKKTLIRLSAVTASNAYDRWVDDFTIGVAPWGANSSQTCQRLNRLNAECQKILATMPED